MCHALATSPIASYRQAVSAGSLLAMLRVVILNLALVARHPRCHRKDADDAKPSAYSDVDEHSVEVGLGVPEVLRLAAAGRVTTRLLRERAGNVTNGGGEHLSQS